MTTIIRYAVAAAVLALTGAAHAAWPDDKPVEVVDQVGTPLSISMV